MTVLQESPEVYIQQCSECGAVLKYALHDIHPEAVPYYDENGELIYVAGFESILCPCCGKVIPTTKERIVPMTDRTNALIELYKECVWESIQEVLGEKIIKECLTHEELFTYMELVAMKKFDIKMSYAV